MLSRSAESIYWMNRYIERAENYARFLDVNFNLSLDLPPNILTQWSPLVVITGDWNTFESKNQEADKNNVIYFLAFDEENPNSIYNSIIVARENARAIRPEITKEVWEQVNYMYYLVKGSKDKKLWLKANFRDFLSEIKKGSQLLYGIFDATISRTDGWHFGKIGQSLERADKTSRVLDVKYHMLLPSAKAVGTPLDLIQWASLLKSVSAYDMYRKKYGRLTAVNILEFLILDKDFPRSMMRCLMQAEQSLQLITGTDNGYANSAQKKLGMLKAQLEYGDINEIVKGGLHDYIDTFQQNLNDVNAAIYESFFSTNTLTFANQEQNQ